jgi:hypothetical protein
MEHKPMLNCEESINKVAHHLSRHKANMYLAGENDLRVPAGDYALALAIVFEEQREPIEIELNRIIEYHWLEVLEDVQNGR